MLILTRRLNERIVIQLGEKRVYVTLLGIKSNQSRVGITAPAEVSVDREEIYWRKQRGAKARANNNATAVSGRGMPRSGSSTT